MVTHEIRIRIALTSRRVRWGLVLFLCLALPRIAGTDDAPSTLTMYYPSASATYSALTSTDETRIVQGGGTAQLAQFGNSGVARQIKVGNSPIDGNRLSITGTLWVDGCIWLPNTNSDGTANAQQNYRCRWAP